MTMKYTEDEKIACVTDYIKSGLSQKAYHRANLDVDFRTFTRWLAKYRAQSGLLPNEKIKGRSTLYKDGEAVIEWVKTDVKMDEAQELLRAFASGLMDDIPRAPISSPITHDVMDMLAALYTLTDAHIGMRSEEWSLEKAEEVIKSWIDYQVKHAPNAHTGVFNVQGDTSHWDSLIPVTPASGHVLDADGSTRQMQRLVIKLVRYCIKKMLEKHQEVRVYYLIGNHDEHTAVLNSEWLDVFYEDDPRVIIDTVDSMFHCFEWGKTGLYFHHGHKRNVTKVAEVFARKFRETYGRTKYSYGHLGHVHHGLKLPQTLMTLEIHPTLAAKDQYADDHGYMSDRGADAIIYHKEYGEVGRNTFRPEMLL